MTTFAIEITDDQQLAAIAAKRADPQYLRRYAGNGPQSDEELIQIEVSAMVSAWADQYQEVFIRSALVAARNGDATALKAFADQVATTATAKEAMSVEVVKS